MIAAKVRTARGFLPLLRQQGSGIAYMGWLGHDNLGDEAIFHACRRELDLPVIRLPREAALARMQALSRGPLFTAGLLGGGTVVGWPGYRALIERLERRCGDVSLFALGVGVLEPGFHYGATTPELSDELVRWAEPLARFERVTVRGNRSRELLAGIGVESSVVGDTALLLADEEPHAGVEQGLIGINVGIAPSFWGDDAELVLREIVAFGREMRRRGWRIRLVSVWPKDDEITGEAATAIGASDVVQGWRGLEQTLEALRECQVFVGVKLHSVVLASGAHVPSLMIEYQPKCREFQESIGREEWSIRADRVTAELLLEHAETLAAESSAHRQALAASVGELRDLLREEVRSIGELARSAR